MSKQSLVTEATHAASDFGAANDVVDEAAAAAFGVNRTDLRIIGLVAASGALTAGRLAAEANLSPAATTTAIQRLTRAGHLTRRTDADDRRRAVVELTPGAAELLAEIYAPIERAGRAILEDYAPEQLALVIEVLRKGERMQRAEAARIRAREPLSPPPPGGSAVEGCEESRR
ncbi:MarR family winged helix-turn-helix transcriptional regulator [Amycolatopsis eburnea]|uniref:MarR family winged helix-turn-helix transcriptional regulator n=1 Tax=Amycolatopsis eburnea TaxID=2267691 RepID=UPI001CDC516E|nr:MarR family transcriptional regulator [Amycolatopsis eburnea]